MWPELVEGDDTGDFISDTHVSEEAHQQLEHLCGDSEVGCKSNKKSFGAIVLNLDLIIKSYILNYMNCLQWNNLAPFMISNLAQAKLLNG